ncbi:hypothetical protein [Tautonia plasticadhaerens]|uniref:Uncharacterized protein n=1 Tax=Tautonia plasticadhaerens TaxID=2527974 RepID=A0A518HEZ4_9BACT|nr:hypothetical protein [Tautonia plasticadhaerens]QDV39401.1 hypothetical protein ElP_73680 [Tautonia plasticadhaerens]
MTTNAPIRPGDHRDDDSWSFVASSGDVGLVAEGGEPEPRWSRVGPPLSEDAEPKVPDPEDLDAFASVRRSYGIPA